MDEELKALLDQAHSAGASEQQLQGIVDLYNKKKSLAQPTPQNNPSQNGPGTFITPHPSSSVVENGSSLLAQGQKDLNLVSKGEAPAADQPPPTTQQQAANLASTPDTPGFRPFNPETALPTNQEGQPKLTKEQMAEEAAPAGDYSPTALVGQFNTGLASITDLGALVARPFDKVMDAITPGVDSSKVNANDVGYLFNWASDWLRKTGKDAPLPNTFTGKAVGGIVQTVPTILGAMASGSGTEEAQLSNQFGGYLAKADILQKALTEVASPLTKYLAVTKGAESGEAAYKANNGAILPTLLGTLKGVQEGTESGIGLHGQMAAGEQIGGGLFKLALKSGVVNEDGVLTEQALKSLVGSPFAFAASSVADDVANGRAVNWQNAGISAVTALPFEASHLVDAAGNQEAIAKNKAALDEGIDKAINQTNNNSIINFATATPDDIHTAMSRPESAQELQIMSLAKGVAAQDSETLQDKNSNHLAQLELQKQADIKSVGEAVIQHGVNGFSESVAQTELPDEMKSALLNRAHTVDQIFNPVTIEENKNKADVVDLTDKINSLQATPGATDPVANPAGTAALIDAVEKRTDLQVELLDKAIDNPDHIPALNEKTTVPDVHETSANSANEEGNIDDKRSVDNENQHGQEPQTKTGLDINPIPETGLTFKSKEHGNVNIVTSEDGQYKVHFHDGSAIEIPKEDIKDLLPDFDEAKIGADEQASGIHHTDNPAEVAKLYDDHVNQLKDTGSKEGAIAAYGPRATADDFAKVNDANNISPVMRLNYFRNTDEGQKTDLHKQAEIINEQYFNGRPVVSANDIAEFMIKYPAGEKTQATPSGNPELREIASRYTELTGKKLTNKRAKQLAEQFNISESEVREIQNSVESEHNTESIKRFIDEVMSKPGLLDSETVMQDISDQFDKYVADPNNEFNIFHEVYKGDILSEEEIKQIKDEIEQTKAEQLTGDTSGEESASETSGEAPFHEEGSNIEHESEPQLAEEDDLPFQRSSGTTIPSERADTIQKLMEKVFPNVETVFHPTLDAFKEAAKANDIDPSDPPNAFVDKHGVIHFNPEGLNADTQIHEYGHILTQWAKENAPALYQRMIAFGKDAKDIHKELSGNGYKLTGSRMAEEAFVTMLGREGEGKLDDVIKNSGTRGTISKFINEVWNKFQRYVIEKTGFDISKLKSIKNMPINEFLDTINSKYLLSENKISDIGTKEYSDVSQQRTRPVRTEGESMAEYAQRIIDWTKEQRTGQKALDFQPEPAEKPGYNFSETSIKNRITAEERRARFLDEVEVTGKRDFGQVWDRAKEMVNNGTIDPGVLADNINKNPRPLSAEESGALLYDRMRLYNDHRTTMDQINDAVESSNRGAETEARARLAYIEDKINNNDISARKAGYEQGLGLAARRMMAAQDYSLANQIQLAQIANGGKELPADVRANMESLSKRLQAAEKKLAEYEENAHARAAVTSLARLRKEVENEVKVQKKQKRVENQEQIKKNIDNIKKDIYAKLFQNKKTTSSIVPYADRLIEITPDLAKLAKEYIKTGINTVEGLVDALHDDLKDHLEGLTKRDLRDALSGYGRNAKPSKDEIEAQLRELKAQARLTSALEDAQNGERPLKSGFTREAPSERVKELQKQVHDAMRENGIEVEKKKISPEDAWKTALESVKTRLKNQIDELNKQLETGQRTEKRPGIIYDKEAEDLKSERDRLKAAIEEAEGSKEMSDEDKVALLTKTTEKSIEEYKKRIEDLKNTGKDSIADERKAKGDKLKELVSNTPELKSLRERLAELQDEHEKIVEEGKPKLSAEEAALDAFKKRMTKRIADLQDKIDKGDYEKAPKKAPIPLDDHAKELQSEVNKLKRKFDENREKLRLANRSNIEKRLDWVAKYRRFVLLSNITTAAKLTAAGVTRGITSPLEEIIGHGLSAIPGISKISEMAPREGGGLSLSAEARSLSEVLSRRSINEMVRTIREGKSALDERVDDKEHEYKQDSAFELPGKIHSALKTVPKQIEYYRSLQKRIEFALRNGYDITSPDVQTSLQIQAFKDQNPELFKGKTIGMSDIEKSAFNDAKRAIFMQDNILSDNWTAMIKRLDQQGPKGQIAATVARIFLPIIKIPTNFVAESSSLAFGAAKAAIALTKGIDNLSPDEADYVLRALKKQGLGAVFFALGYYFPQNVGGLYRQEEKRKKNDLEADDVEIFGEKVPHWLMHAPIFTLMQMGSTVRRVHDQYKHNSQVSGVDEALTSGLTAGKGLFGQIPLFGEPAELSKGLENTESLKKFAANFVLGVAAPYDMQRVAKWMDEDKNGNTIPRKEKGFIQYMEGEIPIVREKTLHRK